MFDWQIYKLKICRVILKWNFVSHFLVNYFNVTSFSDVYDFIFDRNLTSGSDFIHNGYTEAALKFSGMFRQCLKLHFSSSYIITIIATYNVDANYISTHIWVIYVNKWQGCNCNNVVWSARGQSRNISLLDDRLNNSKQLKWSPYDPFRSLVKLSCCVEGL